MPRVPSRRLALIALSCTTLVAGVTPSLARAHHQHHRPGAAPHMAAPASHADIPQSSNIENLNDLSLRRARAGENTSRPLAPPLAQ